MTSRQSTRGASLAEYVGSVGKKRGNAVWRFEKDERRRNRCEPGKPPAPRAGFRRQEADEEERLGRKSGRGERRDDRGGTRDRNDAMAGGDGIGNERRARIGEKRRAGVGDERDRTALGEGVEEPPVRLEAAVLVICGDLRRDAVAVEKPPRHPCVLAGDEVGGGECVEGAERHVGEIADRRRDDIKAGRQRRRVDERTADEVAALRISRIELSPFPAIPRAAGRSACRSPQYSVASRV